MSDAIFYPLLLLLGAAANAILSLSDRIGRKSAAVRLVSDFTLGIIAFAPFPALVLIFRDGVFTAYSFLFYAVGIIAANAPKRFFHTVRKRKNER